ncbi:MAG: phosphonate ABC transporter, permease protein PhnE [Leptolyngbya sp. DLM2.Bin15]|nr:MAG: phosphonate ABC transporter, permease protein PhnE [Leptolyngbya sp. DLM2.Bin15]
MGEQLRRRGGGASGWGGGGGLIILGLFLHGVYIAQLTPERLLSGMGRLGGFLSQAIPPDLTRASNFFWAILVTFEMALVGTVIGVLLSLPVALLASDNTSPNRLVRNITRNTVAAVRTIPDLVWALIFVVAIGLGPAAGILTIAVDNLGFCGRFFSERIEELEPGPVEALSSTGASQLGIILGAIFPCAFPSFVATSLYAVEKSIRSAVVLGLVGAGGIGVELSTSMRLFRYDQALTIIVMIWLVVTASEQVSTQIRRRVI